MNLKEYAISLPIFHDINVVVADLRLDSHYFQAAAKPYNSLRLLAHQRRQGHFRLERRGVPYGSRGQHSLMLDKVYDFVQTLAGFHIAENERLGFAHSHRVLLHDVQ